jgi:hypothetical protein
MTFEVTRTADGGWWDRVRVHTTQTWETTLAEYDPFQDLGIPCWQSFAGPLESIEREFPSAENE